MSGISSVAKGIGRRYFGEPIREDCPPTRIKDFRHGVSAIAVTEFVNDLLDFQQDQAHSNQKRRSKHCRKAEARKGHADCGANIKGRLMGIHPNCSVGGSWGDEPLEN
jgi:hypothetical protein